MKIITVTNENLNYIFGMVKKTLWNKNRTNFMAVHNFNCKLSKHIKPFHNVHNYYLSPSKIEVDSVGGEKYIRIRFDTGCSMLINMGDKVAFSGGRLYVKQKFTLGGTISEVLTPTTKMRD